MSASEPAGEAITPEGLEALKAQLQELETTTRREMADRIRYARSLGDLKENAEYHAAKNESALLETKIKRLQNHLRLAVVTETATGDDTLAFGRTAEIIDEASGKTHVWTIVGATEADLAQGRLSAESPVGRALVGRAPGQSVTVETPRGQKSFRVERLVA
jgi:transcription elongation factor GreA